MRQEEDFVLGGFACYWTTTIRFISQEATTTALRSNPVVRVPDVLLILDQPIIVEVLIFRSFVFATPPYETY